MGIDLRMVEGHPYCMEEFRNILKEAPDDIILVDKNDAHAWTRRMYSKGSPLRGSRPFMSRRTAALKTTTLKRSRCGNAGGRTL